MKRLIIISVFLLSYLCNAQSDKDFRTFYKNVYEGNWYNIRHYFQSKEESERFLSYFTSNPANTSDYRSYYSYKLVSQSNSKAEFLNLNNNNKCNVQLSFVLQEGIYKISRFNVSSETSNLRTEGLQAVGFACLPSNAPDQIKYYTSIQAQFNESGSIQNFNQQATFRQVNFTPIRLKFKWCEKVAFINICGTKTFEKDFGLVLSDKDDPANDNGYVKKNFQSIIDITAYRSNLDVAGFNPSQSGQNYSLTSVIVDGTRPSITLFREGLNPWPYYGDVASGRSFVKPIAVKAINGLVYVLDKGYGNVQPSIHVLKVYNTIVKDSEVGSFGVIYMGNINSSNGGVALANPTDLGGYESFGTYNKLIVSDANGLHVISLNKSDGLSASSNKSFKFAKDIKTSGYFNLGDILKLDSRYMESAADLGNVVLFLGQDKILVLSASELETNSSLELNLNISYDLPPGAFLTNLAYMRAEQKWYLTDYAGKIYKLDSEGRFLGGGGNSGSAEGNNELYFPNAITPNPIGDDPTNDFRYRFMVANRWGLETGIKLFSPGIFISQLKAFENLTTNDLTFAFTTSGKWGYVEGAQSIQVQNVRINNVDLLPALWSTQVSGSVQTDKSTEFLNHFPELITLNPYTLKNGANQTLTLNRGWNKFIINIVVNKIDLNGTATTETVFKEINFYWLPSTPNPFIPAAANSISDVRFNNASRVPGTLVDKDYVYKSVTLGTKALFYIPASHNLWFSGDGNLTLQPNATFFNTSYSKNGLGNLNFSDESKLTLNAGSFICANGEARFQDASPDFSTNFAFDAGYKKGISADIILNFSGSEQTQCKSACVFMAGNTPVVSFSAVVDMSAQSPFKVTVNPAGTTYYNKLKWEVEEVGNTTKNGSVIIDATATTQIINLNEKITYNSVPFVFVSCKDYKITLSIGCNDGSGKIQWTNPTSKIIGINYPVFSGVDQFACDYDNPLQMTDATPISLSGDGTSSKWLTGRATGGMPISLTGVITLSTLASTYKNKKDSVIYSYTDKWNCTKTAVKYVTIYTRPATPASVTTNSPLCEGNLLNLTTPALTNASYKWTLANNQVIESASNTTTFPSSTAMNGTLKATVKLNGCYSLDKTANLVVNPIPVITIPLPEKNFCKNSAAFPLVVNAPTSPVIWTALVGGTATGSDLTKASGADGWNEGAFSLQSVTDGGFVEATAVETNKSRMIGLSPINADADYRNIHYAIYLASTGRLEIYEKGIYQNVSTTYAAQDKVKIMSVGGIIKYYKNNVLIHPSPTPPVYPLYADASLYAAGATLKNVTISSQGTGIWTGTGVTNTGGNYIFTPTTAGLGTFPLTYTFTTTGASCVGSAVQTMNVGPNIQLGPNETICQNSAAFVPSVVSPAGGTWSENGVNLTGNLFNPASKSIGTYSLIYSFTDTYGCTNTATKSITVKGSPTASISPAQPTGLLYKYYENITSTAWTSVANMTGLQTVSEGVSSSVSVTPKLQNANYGLIFEGYVMIPAAGSYTFYLTSKDGSKLTVNDAVIIAHDNVHASSEKASAAIVFTAGLQKIKIEYFNTSYTTTLPDVLSLQWSGPGITKQAVAASYFKSPVTFCEGSSVALTSSSGSSYIWSNGATTGPILNVSTAGNYNVTIKDADGCSVTSTSVIVSQLANPTGEIVSKSGLKYSFYKKPAAATWPNLPDFSTLSPIESGFARIPDLSQVKMGDNVALVYEGYINTAAASHTFYLTSDDGSQLFIDNLLVVDNNGNHGILEKTGVATLRAGLHKIKLLYYNGTSGYALSLSWATSSIPKQVIPSTVLFNNLVSCITTSVALAPTSTGTFLWNNAAVTNTINFSTNGSYSVTVTRPNGCKITAGRNVEITAAPAVTIATSTSATTCFETFTSGVLIADPKGVFPYKYQWKKNGTDIASSANQTLTINSAGSYVIGFTDGCGTTVNSAAFNFDIVKQPEFILSTDLTGSSPVMCTSGSTAKIRADITGYNNSKNYDVILTPGNITSSVAASPALTITDAFNGYELNSSWKYLNTSIKEGEIEVNSTLKLSGWNAGLLSTGSDFTSVWRDDLRGDIDIKVRVNPVVSTNTSARAGIVLANDLKALSGGGHCAVSLGVSKSFMFQYDLNGDGTLETIANTGVISTTFTSAFVRLKKTGTLVTAYYSLGQTPTTWVTIGSATIGSLKSGSQVALFVSSHHTGIIATATLDDFEVMRSQPLIELPISGPGVYTIEVKDKTGNNNCLTVKKSITIGSMPIPAVTAADLSTDEACYTKPNYLILRYGTPSTGKWSGKGVVSAFDDNFEAVNLTPSKWPINDYDGWTGSTARNVNGELELVARGTANQFYAISTTLGSDFDLSVKIVSISNGSSTAAGGIVLSSFLGNLASGPYATLSCNRNGVVEFAQDLASPFGTLDNYASINSTVKPCWLRLKRVGNQLTAYYRSSLTNSWIQVGNPQVMNNLEEFVSVSLYANSGSSTIETNVRMDDFVVQNNFRQEYFYPSQANVGMNTLNYTVTDANGCSNTATKTINVISNLPPSFSLGPDRELKQGESVTLTVPTGNHKILWSPGQITTPSITVKYDAEENYGETVTASLYNSCGLTSDDVSLYVPCPRNYYTNTAATIKTKRLGNFDGTEQVFTGGGVFDGEYHVVGDIRLKAGTYTLNPGTVFYVEKDKNIIVNGSYDSESAQTLDVKGARITAACEYMWGEIQGGSKTIFKTNEAGLPLQNSEISDGKGFKDISINSGNGIQFFFNKTQFLNNYQSVTLSGSQRSFYDCYITNCQFDSYPELMKMPYQMLVNQSFVSNRHIDLSQYAILNNVSILNNTFTRCMSGIYSSYALFASQGVFINNNTFSECFESSIVLDNLRGVKSEISNNVFTMAYDNFRIYNYPNVPIIGINRSGSYTGGVVIKNNNFTKTVNSTRKATAILASMQNTEITKNNITGFDEGVRVTSIYYWDPITYNNFYNNTKAIVLNAENTSGINILCNSFIDNIGVSNDVGIYLEKNLYAIGNNVSNPVRNTYTNQTWNIYNSSIGSTPYNKATNDLCNTVNTYNITFLTQYGSTPFGSVSCALVRNEDSFADEILTEEALRGWNLGENVPNPANHETEIPLEIPTGLGKVIELEIRSINGTDILAKLPVNGTGSFLMKINLNSYASGVYFYTLIADGKKLATKKMIVVK